MKGSRVPPPFHRCLCLAADVSGYGTRDERDHARIQEQFLAVLDRAAAAAAVDRSRWSRQHGGDEELAVIPGGPHEPSVVGDFVRELGGALFRENDGVPRPERLRLRVAIDAGPVAPAAAGFVGAAVLGVVRLVGSEVLHRALDAAPDAGLAVLLSDRVHRDVVVGGYTGLPPAAYRRVHVAVKEFSEPAWLRVPGADVHALSLEDPASGVRHATFGR